MNGILRKVSEIGIFLLCARTIVNFRPKAAYDSYLKLLLALIFMLLVSKTVLGPVAHTITDETTYRILEQWTYGSFGVSGGEAGGFETDGVENGYEGAQNLLEKLTLLKLSEMQNEGTDTVGGDGGW